MSRLVCFLVAFLAVGHSADFNKPLRTEPFAVDLADQRFPKYQAGFVSGQDGNGAWYWVQKPGDDGITRIPLSLPDVDRIAIDDVAVSFQGKVTVTAVASDKEGQMISLIAWLAADGSPIRVVRTSPFGVVKIAFTEDGRLWAAGVEKSDMTYEHEAPVSDVLRCYGLDGKLEGTFLPRLSLSSGRQHPAIRSFLATSRERVAFVSETAQKWVILSSDGTTLSQGPLELPAGTHLVNAAVTDSGRLVLRVNSRESGGFFEVDQESGQLQPVGAEALPDANMAMLMGSEGDDFVLFAPKLGQTVWAGLR